MTPNGPNVGILGIGTYLPEEVRRNDWWPAEVVERWAQRSSRQSEDNPVVPPDEVLVREAMAALEHDPFRGAVERRILAADANASDMEIAAGRKASEAAGIDAKDIDLLLVSSWMPDMLGTNTAATVHAGLGLPTNSFSLAVESACNSFHHQLALAEAMICAGRARYGLLVQSCNITRALPYDRPYSAWFGDGAAAVVVGPVSEGFGILGRAHRTDGALQGGLVMGVPGERWYDEGRTVLYSPQPERSRQMLARVNDCAADAISAALEDAGLEAKDVNFYACHQGFSWLRSVTQAHAGLGHARSVDTFERTGSIAAANIPMVMATGIERGLLEPGDIVVTHSGGSGITWSGVVLRWGQ